MTKADYRRQIRDLFGQLTPVFEKFPRTCDTNPCGYGHYHFEFSEGVPWRMWYWVSLAYDSVVLGRDVWTPRVESDRPVRVADLENAVQWWAGSGMLV